jgi:hypothetical protein
MMPANTFSSSFSGDGLDAGVAFCELVVANTERG